MAIICQFSFLPFLTLFQIPVFNEYPPQRPSFVESAIEDSLRFLRQIVRKITWLRHTPSQWDLRQILPRGRVMPGCAPHAVTPTGHARASACSAIQQLSRLPERRTSRKYTYTNTILFYRKGFCSSTHLPVFLLFHSILITFLCIFCSFGHNCRSFIVSGACRLLSVHFSLDLLK